MLDELPGELFLVLLRDLLVAFCALVLKLLAGLSQLLEGSAQLRVLKDVDTAREANPVTMVEIARSLLNCQRLSIDKGVDGRLSHDTQFKQAVLLQLDLAVILLDSDGAKDDVRLRCSCLAAN